MATVPSSDRQIVAVETGAVSGRNPGYYYVDTRPGAEQKLLFQRTSTSDVYAKTQAGFPTSGKFFGKGAGGPEGVVTIRREVPRPTQPQEMAETVYASEVRQELEFNPQSRLAQEYGMYVQPDTSDITREYGGPGIVYTSGYSPEEVRQAIEFEPQSIAARRFAPDTRRQREEFETRPFIQQDLQRVEEQALGPSGAPFDVLAPGPQAVQDVFGDRYWYNLIEEKEEMYRERAESVVTRGFFPGPRSEAFVTSAVTAAPSLVAGTFRGGLDLTAGAVDIVATGRELGPAARTERRKELTDRELDNLQQDLKDLETFARSDPLTFAAVAGGSIVGTGVPIAAAPKSVRTGLTRAIQPGEQILTEVGGKLLGKSRLERIPGGTLDIEEIVIGSFLKERPVSKRKPSPFADLEVEITEVPPLELETQREFAELEKAIERGDYNFEFLMVGAPVALKAQRARGEFPGMVRTMEVRQRSRQRGKMRGEQRFRPISEIYRQEQKQLQRELEQSFEVGRTRMEMAFEPTVMEQVRRRQEIRKRPEVTLETIVEPITFERTRIEDQKYWQTETQRFRQETTLEPRELELEMLKEIEQEPRRKRRKQKRKTTSRDGVEEFDIRAFTKELNFDVGDWEKELKILDNKLRNIK